VNDADRMCRARSKLARQCVPDSYFICTNDAGHQDQDPEHTACNGDGRVIARWRSESSAIEVWMPAYAVIT